MSNKLFRLVDEQLLAPINHWLRARESREVTLEGVRFLLPREEPPPGEMLRRLEAGVALLSAVDARAWKRLQRSVSAVFVGENLSWLNFDRRYRVLELSQEYVLQVSGAPEPVAFFLIHGATVAWLSGPTAPPERSDRPDRAERLHRLGWRAQLNSARRWAEPEYVEWIEDFSEAGSFVSPREWFEGAIEKLRLGGAPEWLLRWVRRLMARRLRQDLH